MSKWNRREFLRTAGLGAAGISLGKDSLLIPQRAVGATGVREIELVAREVQWELAPGKVVKAMTYAGQVPGPTLRVREGERVRITVTSPCTWKAG
ncbi:MAG: multicopper oxidase domain-containing protein [candidate division NC10 bacterium]|nr:multicopper oxidase domain-containing protein [candidate division NC10 bacterium]